MGKGLTLVIPVYNEAELLPASLERCFRELAPFFPALEIVVVDDGSSDGSGPAAAALAGRYPGIKILRHERNRNIGHSLAGGFAAAAGPLVVYSSADLPLAPGDIAGLARRAAAVDLLVVERKSYPGAGPWRLFISLANRILLRLLFPLAGSGIRDFNFTVFFDRRCWTLIRPRGRSPGFFVPEMILRARRSGLRVAVARADYHPRTGGRSTLGGPRDIAWSLLDMFRFRLAPPGKTPGPG